MFAFVTVMNAQEVASLVQDIYKRPGDRYFKLAYHPTSNDKEVTEAFVRPKISKHPFTIADKTQVIICETEDGGRLDLIIPGLLREFQPARVALPPPTQS